MFGFKKPLSEEDRIRQGILDRAKEMAEQTYRKDVMFRALQQSDFTYAIMDDLMKAAKLTGRVTIKFVNGTEVVIENREEYPDDPRKELEELYKKQLI